MYNARWHQCAMDTNFGDADGDAVQLVLDPSVFFENNTVTDTIELYSRELIEVV